MFRSLKWLYPGMQIKRWIGVICLGIMLAMLGVGGLLIKLLAIDSVQARRAEELAVVGFLLGGIALFIGFYRLLRSIGELVKPSGEEKDLVEIAYERRYLSRGPRIVALGGGTGMSNLLTGLKKHTREITAVVSVADDGGSSGRLREAFEILPPGDIRKCLISLSDESPRLGALLGYRFPDDELDGHAFGNLFLTALTRITGDFGEAVREAGRILSIRGRVIPATLDHVTLVAAHADGSSTTGQRLISESERRVCRVRLEPNPGPAAADLVEAIEQADLIVMGPGSLYTSVIPNLLIEGMPDAIRRAKAVKVYVCNVMTHEGETRGFSVREHIDALRLHAGRGLFDYLLVNNGTFPAATIRQLEEREIHPLRWDPAEFEDETPPFEVVEADIVSRVDEMRHDPAKLARALTDLLERVSHG